MERAHLSITAQGRARPELAAARERAHYSLEEVAERLNVSKSTVHRWEKKGDIPQPLHIRELCKLFGVSARELGFDEPPTIDVQTIMAEQEKVEEERVLTAFRQQNLTSRLMRIVWNWSRSDARYQKLQLLIMLELEDNSMNDISRRDALRFLALVPADMLGLSQFQAVFKKEFSYEDILKHCAAAITACWHLRKGKELAFADRAVAKCIPTLKAMTQTAPTIQRKAAADLLAQCLLLKSVLSWNIAATNDAITYAQQAEGYSVIASSRLLQITALRTQAAAFCYANQWKQALRAAEQAKFLLEEGDRQNQQKQISVSSQPAEEPIPHIVHSYVYAGLATYQAYDGNKEDALLSLKKAHNTFFAQPDNEVAPLWIDHSVGNLLNNDGSTHMHLGLYKGALDSLGQIDTQYAKDTSIPVSCRITSIFDQITAEVNRDDQPRDLQWCIDLWIKGVKGAKELKSQKRLDEAVQTYAVMRAVWPGEKQVKDLREYILH